MSREGARPRWSARGLAALMAAIAVAGNAYLTLWLWQAVSADAGLVAGLPGARTICNSGWLRFPH